MNSLVYFYSKFTEEFLLLGAAGVFTLLSVYCYHWVIQKRRMGVARSQIPSTVVKSYLNQLINEAEFVRAQLFGLAEGRAYVPPAGMHPFPEQHHVEPSPASESHAEIPSDLLDRINALEGQLKDKESLVININLEKTKLAEEIEKLKKSPPPAAAGNQDQLVQKIKNLESRLEEYALFEEDLANLKRLQQENTQLKKKIGEMGLTPESVFAAAPKEQATPDRSTVSAPEIPKTDKASLDQGAIESLLNGVPATPAEIPKPRLVEAPAPVPAPVEAKETPAPSDQFEVLVDSVENSLEAAPAPVATTPEEPKEEESALANKTDEELLKEFENLLNS